MLKNVQQELNRFAKYVIQQSRTNLTKSKKNSSKELYNSLDYDLNVSPNSFSMSFLMEDYGIFQDKGVKGKTSSNKAPNSPFKFGSGRGKKGGLTEGIDKWVRRKFTKPFQKAFKNLDKDIIEAYKLDVEELLKFTTNGNN